MSQHYTVNKDLTEVEAMVSQLSEYVRQDQLYGNAGGGSFTSGTLPKLTVGAVLLRLRRLEALHDHLDPQQVIRLEKVQYENAQVSKEWRYHYQQKMLREASSRLDAMLPFFDEYRKNPDFGTQVYKPEAMRRTIVQELLPIINEHNLDAEAIQNKVTSVDGQLRSCLEKSAFMWDELLQPVYPESTFWWLYRQPVPGRTVK